MILILSNAYEPTTDMVIEWLIYKHKDFIRLNSEDMTQVDLNNLMNLSGKFTWLGGQKIDLSAVNVVWYRRWYNYSNIPPPDGTWVGRQLRQELRNEATEMSNFFFKLLGDRKWLSHPFTTRFHNKLYTLFLARKLGIKVPDTIVATQKSVLLDFYRDHPGGIITKPIADPPVYVDGEGTHFKTFTEVLTLDIIRDLPEHFFSSMVQQRVKAKHEIRIYYLDGKFYATAIMNSTTVDIKLSVGFKGMEVNMIPFRLPESLEEKLHRLMLELDLNAGSIDVIKDINDDFYFLEVNPIGQFIGYSNPVNYNLAEVVADWLISNDTKVEEQYLRQSSLQIQNVNFYGD